VAPPPSELTEFAVGGRATGQTVGESPGLLTVETGLTEEGDAVDDGEDDIAPGTGDSPCVSDDVFTT
jgi:hypothetical protein